MAIHIGSDYFRAMSSRVLLSLLCSWLLLWGFAVPDLFGTLPIGREGVATVPLFNAWTIGWNIQQAEVGFSSYWQAPLFWPDDHAFIYCETQLPSAVGLVLPHPERAILFYNLYLWLTLALNGIVAASLLRQLSISQLPCLLAGFLMISLPYVCWQSGVLQLTVLWPSLWLLSGLLNYFRIPSLSNACLCACGLVMIYLTCHYYGLMMITLIPFLLLAAGLISTYRTQVFRKALINHVLLAAVIVGIGLGWLILPQQHWLGAEEFERSTDTIWGLSAKPSHWLTPPEDNLARLWSGENQSQTARHWATGVGWVLMLTSAIGGCIGLVTPHLRKPTIILGTLAVVGWVLSLGFYAELFGVNIYETLRQSVPGISRIRSPHRYGVYTQMVAVLLTGFFLQWLSKFSGLTLERASWRNWPSYLLLCGVGGIAIFQGWPAPSAVIGTPRYQNHQAWLAQLEKIAQEGEPLSCFPYPESKEVEAHYSSVKWMYLSLWHKHPITNGYAGYFPETFLESREDFASFPESAAFDRLKQWKIRTILVNASRYEKSELSEIETHGYKLQYHDKTTNLAIYQKPE